MPEGQMQVQLSNDVINEAGQRRYEVCDYCNYDRHQCGGCGEELSHNGMEKRDGVWVEHNPPGQPGCWE